MTEPFCFSCVHQIEDNYKQKRLGGYTSDNYKNRHLFTNVYCQMNNCS